MKIKHIDHIKNTMEYFIKNYEYLDFTEHDIEEFNSEIPNGKTENLIYSILFDSLVEPLIEDYRKEGLEEDEIIFNFFCVDDGTFHIQFYRPNDDIIVRLNEEKMSLDVIKY